MANLQITAILLLLPLACRQYEHEGHHKILEERDELFLKHQSKSMIDNCPYHPVPVDLPEEVPAAIADAVEQVQDYLSTILSNTVPGIVWSLIYQDEVLASRGLGVKKKGFDDPPDGKTIFRVASVTKVITVIFLYQLVERGFNMSGLPTALPCKPSTEDSWCPSTTEDILNELKSWTPIHKPWSVPFYSNLGYALLGRCLQDSLLPPGTTFEDYVKENILEPLSMHDTGFEYTSSVRDRMATGYSFPFGLEVDLINLDWASPVGQMHSTTDDLNKLAMFFLSAANVSSSSWYEKSYNFIAANEVLSEVRRREMMLPTYIHRNQETGFGLPWEFLFQSDYTINRKAGNLQGFTALFSFIPDLQVGMSVLFSGTLEQLSVSRKIYSYLIPAFVSELASRQKPYPYPPNPEIYEGVYVADTGEPDYTIKTVESPMGPQLALISLNLTMYLSYIEPLKMQVDYADNIQPCLFEEIVGIRKQLVYFAPTDNSNHSPSFIIPEAYHGRVFEWLP